jgi:hypothetical protein
MGNTSIWYYPDSAGGLEEIDFGAEGISSVIEMPVRDVRDSHSIGGAWHRTVLGGGLKVRLVCERFSGISASGRRLARQLSSLEAHLHRGGLMVFSADRANAWLGVMEGTLLPQRGDATLTTFGGNLLSVFTSTGTAATLAAGDELYLESFNPTMHREQLLVSSLSGNVITLDTSDGSNVRYDYADQGTAIVRDRNFYPALRLPDDQVGRTLLSTDNRLSWTWDATFELDYLAISSLIPAADVLADANRAQGYASLDELAKAVTAGSTLLDFDPTTNASGTFG